MGMEQGYKNKIKQLDGVNDQLNGWEKGFMETMCLCVSKDYSLKPGQKKKLDEIFEDHFGEGKGPKDGPITRGCIKAEKGDDGWVISIDNQEVGLSESRTTASAVVAFLHEHSDSLDGYYTTTQPATPATASSTTDAGDDGTDFPPEDDEEDWG